jgi:hypothetical protein
LTKLTPYQLRWTTISGRRRLGGFAPTTRPSISGGREALYISASKGKSIPHYKVEGVLLFERDELDRWLEEHRVEPRGGGSHYGAPPARRRPAHRSPLGRGTSGVSENRLGELLPKSTPKKRERPLRPPLSGTEEQKDLWARDLEITRSQLDEMSPPEFEKAWKARNERLEAAGVFEHLTELEEKYGQELWSMPPSQLIQAAGELVGSSETM